MRGDRRVERRIRKIPCPVCQPLPSTHFVGKWGIRFSCFSILRSPFVLLYLCFLGLLCPSARGGKKSGLIPPRGEPAFTVRTGPGRPAEHLGQIRFCQGAPVGGIRFSGRIVWVIQMAKGGGSAILGAGGARVHRGAGWPSKTHKSFSRGRRDAAQGTASKKPKSRCQGRTGGRPGVLFPTEGQGLPVPGTWFFLPFDFRNQRGPAPAA